MSIAPITSTTDSTQAQALGEQLLKAMTGRGTSDEEECIRLVQAGADLNMRDSQGLTALHWAAEHGHSKLTKILLDHHADVDATQTDTANTPLMFAAQSAHNSVMKILLRHGADVHLLNDDGKSALLFAAGNSSCEKTIRLLLAAGANAGIQDKHSNSVLHGLGEKKNHARLFDCLIRKGANIDAQGPNGCTILYYAAMFGEDEKVAFLLARGASTQVRAHLGRTAEEVARTNSHIKAADLIREHDEAPLRRKLAEETAAREAFNQEVSGGIPLKSAIKPCPGVQFRKKPCP